MYGVGFYSPGFNRLENIPFIIAIAIVIFILSLLINWLYKTNKIKLALKLQALIGVGIFILLGFLIITPIILILFVLIIAHFNLNF